jgi:hypothetical protein
MRNHFSSIMNIISTCQYQQLGREVDHSPPSSTKVKNSGATLPLPHIIKHRDSFTFFLPPGDRGMQE